MNKTKCHDKKDENESECKWNEGSHVVQKLGGKFPDKNWLPLSQRMQLCMKTAARRSIELYTFLSASASTPANVSACATIDISEIFY